MSSPRFLTLLGMIVFAALARLVPHLWNVSPVAAMALFAGAHFSNKVSAFFVPLAALALSDLFLGAYPEMPFVYGTFAMIVVIGLWLKNNKSIAAVAGASVGSSVMFFFITNFATWLVGGIYPLTGAGLSACYAAAMPFFRNTLIGDLFFTALLFGSFAWAERKVPSLQEQPAR